MIKKLRVKFIAVNMSIVIILLCVILGLVVYFTRANLEKESVAMMRAIAERPFRELKPGKREDVVQLPYFLVQFAPNGEYKLVNSGYYDLSDAELVDEILATVLSSERRMGVIGEYGLRYYYTENQPDRCIVFADASSELSTLAGLMKTCLMIGALSLLVFFAVSFMLSKWAVKPVDAAWKQQRQFVADASHELKTPLTVILTNAEFLQSPDYDAESKRRFSDSIAVMAKKMRGLTERLLELARMDNGQAKTAFAKLDLSVLASNAALPFEPIFFEKGLTLETKLEKGISVMGSEERLDELIEILLDNAQKYSSAGGATCISIERASGRRCVLRVINEGAQIDKKDINNLFKRFYRADKARTGDGSFGLGLSIAEAIVRAHGGKIWAESENGLNAFCAELPIA